MLLLLLRLTMKNVMKIIQDLTLSWRINTNTNGDSGSESNSCADCNTTSHCNTTHEQNHTVHDRTSMQWSQVP